MNKRFAVFSFLAFLFCCASQPLSGCIECLSILEKRGKSGKKVTIGFAFKSGRICGSCATKSGGVCNFPTMCNLAVARHNELSGCESFPKKTGFFMDIENAEGHGNSANVDLDPEKRKGLIFFKIMADEEILALMNFVISSYQGGPYEEASCKGVGTIECYISKFVTARKNFWSILPKNLKKQYKKSRPWERQDNRLLLHLKSLDMFLRFAIAAKKRYGKRCNMAHAMHKEFEREKETAEKERFRWGNGKPCFCHKKTYGWCPLCRFWGRRVNEINALRDLSLVTKICMTQQEKHLRRIFVIFPRMFDPRKEEIDLIERLLCGLGYESKYRSDLQKSGPFKVGVGLDYFGRFAPCKSLQNHFAKEELSSFVNRIFRCCDTCSKHKPGASVCARCKLTSYCDRKCQKKAWNAHKKVCRDYKKVQSRENQKCICGRCEKSFATEDECVKHCFRFSCKEKINENKNEK